MSERDSRASEEALDWLVALRDEGDDPAVRLAHANWIAADAANARAWEEAGHLWRMLGSAHAESLLTERGVSSRRRGNAVRRGVARRSLVLAALIAASVWAMLVLRPMFDIWLNADHVTGIAETRRIELEDGSIAFLAPDSALDLAFEPDERRVRLMSGQAYFDVVSDSDRPFVVQSAEVETRVLGTAFDVMQGSSGVSVSVERGMVTVSTSTSPSVQSKLAAGDWIRVSGTGAVERGKVAPELVGGWRSGLLVVEDRPILEVVGTLARYQEARVYIADSLLASRRVTGVYDLHSPLDALEAVAAAHHARIRHIGPWLLVLSSL